MDREKLKVLLEEIKDSDTDIVNWTMKSLLGDLINALLEEPKPVATETGMDERTRMKKLILEMLEIV